MSQKKQMQEFEYNFKVGTMDMVEETLKNMNESLITVAGLKKILPRQVNHNTLLEILDRLQRDNKIYMSVRGIVYIYNPSEKLRKAGFKH